jgi:hypothetical protein
MQEWMALNVHLGLNPWSITDIGERLQQPKLNDEFQVSNEECQKMEICAIQIDARSSLMQSPPSAVLGYQLGIALLRTESIKNRMP